VTPLAGRDNKEESLLYDAFVDHSQTKPENRPSLDEIEAHPFLCSARERIPRSLPTSALYTAPDLSECKSMEPSPTTSATTASSTVSVSENQHQPIVMKKSTNMKKTSTMTAANVRRPLAPRDVNIDTMTGAMERLVVDPKKAVVAAPIIWPARSPGGVTWDFFLEGGGGWGQKCELWCALTC